MESIHDFLAGVPRVMIGVSDSEAGRAALRFAVHEAKARRVALHLVRVWPDVAWLGSMSRDDVSHMTEWECTNQRVLAAALGTVRELAPALDVIPEFAAGDLYSTLQNRTRGACLVVLGRSDEREDGYRTDRWFEQHVDCPVVVVDADGSIAESTGTAASNII
jgi:Universal stress protein family